MQTSFVSFLPTFLPSCLHICLPAWLPRPSVCCLSVCLFIRNCLYLNIASDFCIKADKHKLWISKIQYTSDYIFFNKNGKKSATYLSDLLVFLVSLWLVAFCPPCLLTIGAVWAKATSTCRLLLSCTLYSQPIQRYGKGILEYRSCMW